MTDDCHDRILYFEGAKNVRDLGGLPTASGKTTRYRAIYRGDGLSRLTEADLERIRDIHANCGALLTKAHRQSAAPAPRAVRAKKR